MRPRKDGTPAHVRRAGDVVNGFRLVEHVGKGRWRLACVACGGDERVDTPRQVETKGARCWTCRPAYMARSDLAARSAYTIAKRKERRGRVCRWCGRTDAEAGFPAARECVACQRIAQRNGREPDGRPVARMARRVGVLGKGVSA